MTGHVLVDGLLVLLVLLVGFAVGCLGPRWFAIALIYLLVLLVGFAVGYLAHDWFAIALLLACCALAALEASNRRQRRNGGHQ